MKLIVIVFLLSLNAFAVNIEVKNLCSDEALYTGSYDVHENSTVGELSIHFFNENKLPYVGDENGVNSLLNTVVGLDSLQVLSDNEMYAYGWCYHINKVLSSLLINQQLVKSDDQIIWYFGAYHYKDGEWLGACLPAHKVVNNPFCFSN